MKLTSSLICLFAVCAFTGCSLEARDSHSERSSGRDHVPTHFSAQQIVEDLSVLERAVVSRHPRFHDEAPDAAFIQAFQDAKAAASAASSHREAFATIASLNPVFRDAHTLVMPDFERRLGMKLPKGFPLYVRTSAEEITVEGDWTEKKSGARIPANTRILEINGVSAKALMTDLVRFGHGETEQLRFHMIGVMFSQWLATVKGWRGEFGLLLETSTGPTKVQLAPQDEWSSEVAGSSADLPDMRDLGAGIALLRVPTFDVDEKEKMFRDAVRSSFSRIRASGAHSLIIDVRGNTGGQSDAGAEVLQYLTAVPINQVSRARERLHEGNRGVFGYKGAAGTLREMDLTRDGVVKPIADSQRFKGRTVVLIDEMTYSAAILFAAAFRDHNLGRLVGRPTGGYANQTGNMEPLTLPNTRLVAYIPSRVFLRPNGDTRLGPLVPDVLVPVSRNQDVDDVSAATEVLTSNPRSRQDSSRAF